MYSRKWGLKSWFSREWSCNSSSLEKSAIQERRMTFTQRLNFWLVDITIETQEEPPKISQSRPAEYSVSDCLIVVRRSIHPYFRVPFFQHRVIFQYQTSPWPYSNSFAMQLRTYNIVPQNWPIFEACCNLDLLRVRELLGTRSASPFHDYEGA